MSSDLTPEQSTLIAPIDGVPKQTALRQVSFLLAYVKHGVISKAAAETGVTIGTVYTWRKSKKSGAEFNSKMQLAFALFQESLLSEVIRRGRDGFEEPVIYRGELQFKRDPETQELLLDESGFPIPLTVTKYSDAMLKLALSTSAPTNPHLGEGPIEKIEVVIIDAEPDT